MRPLFASVGSATVSAREIETCGQHRGHISPMSRDAYPSTNFAAGEDNPLIMEHTEENDIHARIKARLATKKMTPNAASLKAGLDKSYLRKMFERQGSHPNLASARKLAPILDMTIDELLGEDAPEPSARELVRHHDALPPVPVRGTVAGSHESGAFQFDGSDIEYVDRFPALANRFKVYALYVEGDSMFPEHKAGAIRFVDPSITPQIGDSVVITVMDPDRGLYAVLGHLVRRGEVVVIGKLNPPREIEFQKLTVHSIHRVLTDNELAGMQR